MQVSVVILSPDISKRLFDVITTGRTHDRPGSPQQSRYNLYRLAMLRFAGWGGWHTTSIWPPALAHATTGLSSVFHASRASWMERTNSFSEGPMPTRDTAVSQPARGPRTLTVWRSVARRHRHYNGVDQGQTYCWPRVTGNASASYK